MSWSQQNVAAGLSALLEVEMNSIFAALDDRGIYIPRQAAALREPLSRMAAQNRRNTKQIAQLIHQLGGSASIRRDFHQQTFEAFTSLQYMLPALIAAKQSIIDRYQESLAALGDAPQRVFTAIHQQLEEHRQDLAVLRRGGQVPCEAEK